MGITIGEWINWQEYVHENCWGCRYFDVGDYSCTAHECHGKQPRRVIEDEQSEA